MGLMQLPPLFRLSASRFVRFPTIGNVDLCVYIRSIVGDAKADLLENCNKQTIHDSGYDLRIIRVRT